MPFPRISAAAVAATVLAAAWPGHALLYDDADTPALVRDDLPALSLRIAGTGYAGRFLDIAGPIDAGHAHLYIDRHFFGEIEGNRVLLPALREGTREVAVSLDTADHRSLVAGGKVLAERIYLKVPRGSSIRLAAEPQALDVSLAAGRLVSGPDTVRFKRGDTVRLNWASDAPISLHLHGYDIEAQVSPESPASMLFTADSPGRFPIEQHGVGTGRNVLYVEVYP